MHFTRDDYQFANASINRKLDLLTKYSQLQSRLANQIADPTTPDWKKDAAKSEIAILNRDKDGLLADANYVNQLYWPNPKNRRPLRW